MPATTTRLAVARVLSYRFAFRRDLQRREAAKAMTLRQKVLWAILMAGLTGLLYLAFRGYLAPSMLLDFANSMLC